MPKVISIGSKKGGVAKSTTALHLAAQLARHARVLLVDADDQLFSAYKQVTKGGPDRQAQWGCDVITFQDFDPDRAAGYDYVVLDTKGGEGKDELVNLAHQSALLIVPSKPDGVSSDGLIETLRPLIEAGCANYRVLLTDVPPPPNSDGLEMRLELQTLGIPLFAQDVRHAVAISKAAQQGLPVRDVRGDRYAKLVWLDYDLITREVLDRVHA